MIRYMLAACALKVFSINNATNSAYRWLGNVIGAQKRVKAGIPQFYLDRARKIIADTERFDAIKPGDRLLEIGTGWFHWESTILRLVHDVEVNLVDVWDNRQFPVFKEYFAVLDKTIEKEIPSLDGKINRVHEYLSKLQQTNSFDEAYQILGHKYFVNPKGTLDQFPDNHFNLIFSSSVLEHVTKEDVPAFMKDCYRVLKPGGLCIHLVDLGDHLTLYDKTMPYNKNYLRYSNSVWRSFFENKVQYFNRIQRSEWMKYFADAGFVVVEERPEPINISDVKISKDFAKFGKDDLECLTLNVVHRKP
ncbi:MAG: methyltransferase domain-containing protein [Ignavibacteriae bacterium]|nr:methyltransferase domain-containing protein [Ignavibacteriota bacterium]